MILKRCYQQIQQTLYALIFNRYLIDISRYYKLMNVNP